MIRKKVLNTKRIRKINGGFCYIPHPFLADGFLASLSQKEILLYFFLVLASDRNGYSYYTYDSICRFLRITIDQYIEARDGLVDKDLITSGGSLFQVLSLLDKPTIQAVQKERGE